MADTVIYACSHRRGGNSDHTAELLAEGVDKASGTPEILYVRNYDILDCLACGYCEESKRQGVERCVLGPQDQAYELFAPLLTARTIFFTSPIYFYHLPSRMKTWIDRSQQFWAAKANGESWICDLPHRTAHVVMHAGRPTGEKLFEGAQVTMKYFLRNFNITPADPLLFRGIDARGDLSGKPDLENSVMEFARTALDAR